MRTIAYIAVSLDGYIADVNGGIDWLMEIPNPDQSDFGFGNFMQGVDGILMGSNTFKVVHSFGEWPYEKPVFVASRSLKEVPTGYEDRISIVRGDICEIVNAIHASGVERIYVDGGEIIQSCLQAGILDEMILTHIPILLGGGIPLFPVSDETVHFGHKETQVVGSGLVKSHYVVNRDSRKMGST